MSVWFSDLAAVIRVESVQTLWQYIRGCMYNGSPKGLFKGRSLVLVDTAVKGGFKEVGHRKV